MVEVDTEIKDQHLDLINILNTVLNSELNFRSSSFNLSANFTHLYAKITLSKLTYKVRTWSCVYTYLLANAGVSCQNIGVLNHSQVGGRAGPDLQGTAPLDKPGPVLPVLGTPL